MARELSEKMDAAAHHSASRNLLENDTQQLFGDDSPPARDSLSEALAKEDKPEAESPPRRVSPSDARVEPGKPSASIPLDKKAAVDVATLETAKKRAVSLLIGPSPDATRRRKAQSPVAAEARKVDHESQGIEKDVRCVRINGNEKHVYVVLNVLDDSTYVLKKLWNKEDAYRADGTLHNALDGEIFWPSCRGETKAIHSSDVKRVAVRFLQPSETPSENPLKEAICRLSYSAQTCDLSPLPSKLPELSKTPVATPQASSTPGKTLRTSVNVMSATSKPGGELRRILSAELTATKKTAADFALAVPAVPVPVGKASKCSGPEIMKPPLTLKTFEKKFAPSTSQQKATVRNNGEPAETQFTSFEQQRPQRIRKRLSFDDDDNAGGPDDSDSDRGSFAESASEEAAEEATPGKGKEKTLKWAEDASDEITKLTPMKRSRRSGQKPDCKGCCDEPTTGSGTKKKGKAGVKRQKTESKAQGSGTKATSKWVKEESPRSAKKPRTEPKAQGSATKGANAADHMGPPESPAPSQQSTLFSEFIFCFTMLEDKALKTSIKKHGGTLIASSADDDGGDFQKHLMENSVGCHSSFSIDELAPSSSKPIRNVVLLSRKPVKKTIKYWFALAAGAPILDIEWAKLCLSQRALLPTDRYLLSPHPRPDNSLRPTPMSSRAFFGASVSIQVSKKHWSARLHAMAILSGARLVVAAPALSGAEVFLVTDEAGWARLARGAEDLAREGVKVVSWEWLKECLREQCVKRGETSRVFKLPAVDG